ncbi:MAG: hypothetical protein F6K39_26125 [Okeania sp. SIO3B3]|nr:hypothetical protein [Okeania sp. SIO3B3]
MFIAYSLFTLFWRYLISCSVKYLYFGEKKAEGRRQKAEGREQSLK